MKSKRHSGTSRHARRKGHRNDDDDGRDSGSFWLSFLLSSSSAWSCARQKVCVRSLVSQSVLCCQYYSWFPNRTMIHGWSHAPWGGGTTRCDHSQFRLPFLFFFLSVLVMSTHKMITIEHAPTDTCMDTHRELIENGGTTTRPCKTHQP